MLVDKNLRKIIPVDENNVYNICVDGLNLYFTWDQQTDNLCTESWLTIWNDEQKGERKKN